MSQTAAPQGPAATAPGVSSDVTSVDVASPEASAPDGVADSEPSVSLHSADDIAAYLDRQDQAKTQPGPPSEEDAEAAEAQPGGEPELEEGTQGEEAAEAVSPPASWGKKDQELFATLPQAAKAVIAKREAERDAFVKTKAEEANRARQDHDKLAQYAQNQLTAAISGAMAAIDGDFAGIDMLALQRSDPQTFLQVDAMRKQRLASIQDALKRNQELRDHLAQQEVKKQQDFFKEEIKVLKGRLEAVNGEGFDVPKWKGEVEKYLEGMGCPKEHMPGITHAYQVELIAKAMQYDRLKANAAQAEKKVAEAPKVMKTTGTGQLGDGRTDKQKQAWKNLRANPKSTEAIAGLLNAMG